MDQGGLARNDGARQVWRGGVGGGTRRRAPVARRLGDVLVARGRRVPRRHWDEGVVSPVAREGMTVGLRPDWGGAGIRHRRRRLFHLINRLAKYLTS